MADYKLLINGELVESVSGKKVEDIGPASGEAIAEVPVTTAEDVERAVAAAREAFDDGRWSKLPHGARAAALEKLAMAIEATPPSWRSWSRRMPASPSSWRATATSHSLSITCTSSRARHGICPVLPPAITPAVTPASFAASRSASSHPWLPGTIPS